MSSHDEDQAEAARTLCQVLTVLLDATDPYTAAIWLTTPADEFDGMAAVDAVRAGRGMAQRVLAEAQRDGEQWKC